MKWIVSRRRSDMPTVTQSRKDASVNPYASGDSTIGVASSHRGTPTVLPVFAAAAFIFYRWNLKTYLLAIPKPRQPFLNYAENLSLLIVPLPVLVVLCVAWKPLLKRWRLAVLTLSILLLPSAYLWSAMSIRALWSWGVIWPWTKGVWGCIAGVAYGGCCLHIATVGLRRYMAFSSWSKTGG